MTPRPPQRRAPATGAASQRSGRGKRTDKADLIQKEMQRSDGKAHQRGTVVALSRRRAVLVLGGKRSQATFPENNVWLHGRKQGAKEKDFQPGSIFFFFLPPHHPRHLCQETRLCYKLCQRVTRKSKL